MGRRENQVGYTDDCQVQRGCCQCDRLAEPGALATGKPHPSLTLRALTHSRLFCVSQSSQRGANLLLLKHLFRIEIVVIQLPAGLEAVEAVGFDLLAAPVARG